MKNPKWLIALAAGAGVAAVAYTLLSKDDIPEGATPVQPFDKSRFLGKWYEVARMPSLIEKNLRRVTEEYSLNPDGTIKVITSGINIKTNEPKDATGKLKFAGSEYIGMLKVSYFGPFYAAYNILDIDADYRYALVSSSGLSYLWILSRETTIPDDIKTQFLKTAEDIGFAVDKLEWM